MAAKRQITDSPEAREALPDQPWLRPAGEVWDREAPIALRLLRARVEIATLKLWERFAGNDRQFEAFSIHLLANAVEGVLARHGVTCHFEITRWHRAGNGTLIEGVTVFCAVDTGEERRVPTFGEGVDDSDRGSGKAISYARKNGMVQGLNLGIGINNEAETVRPSREAQPTLSGEPPQAASSLVRPDDSGFSLLYMGRTVTYDAHAYVFELQRALMLCLTPDGVDRIMTDNKSEMARLWHADSAAGYACQGAIAKRREVLASKQVA